MDFTFLYWHWLIFGALLIIFEIVVPNFTIFWFGLGAVLVAAVLWLFPALSVSWQLLAWAVASSLFTILWFKVVKPGMTDRTTAGISREAAIGETGQVIRLPAGNARGRVRFTTPLLGAEEWSFICEESVDLGDRVFVRDISGNTLVVAKENPKTGT